MKTSDLENLSALEMFICDELLAGKIPKEIAFNLGIGSATVRVRLSRIYKKLDVTDKKSLIAELNRRMVEMRRGR